MADDDADAEPEAGPAQHAPEPPDVIAALVAYLR